MNFQTCCCLWVSAAIKPNICLSIQTFVWFYEKVNLGKEGCGSHLSGTLAVCAGILAFNPAHRVANERRGILKSQFLSDMRPMHVDGFGTQIKFACDFAAGFPSAKQFEDFEFAIAELLDGGSQAAGVTAS